MKNEIRKFLEFNGKVIYFLSKDATYWIAIKPICEALNVDYIRQFKNLKEHHFLSQLLSEQTMVATDGKLRKMVCLPEKFVYGWLFSINSESEELKLYQFKCYEVLYDYFHGTLVKRHEILSERELSQAKKVELADKLRQSSPEFEQYEALSKKVSSCNKSLKAMDTSLLQGQMQLF